MGYTIEISFDIRKQDSFSTLKNKLIDIAESKNCNYCYSLHEMEGKYATDRNHCIITSCFDSSEQCIEFIKVIKKLRKIYIECIYTNTPTFKLIYVSSYYFSKKMSKEGKQKYKKNVCSEEEEAIKSETKCSK